MATIKVDGLRELGAAFAELQRDVQGRVARATTNAGAQVIRKIAQRRAPAETGNLRRNVIVKRLPAAETQLTSEHIVTVRQGRLSAKQKQRGLRDAYYARFVEFGTVQAPAQPFMRPALDEGKEAAIEAMKGKLKARIDKANKK